MVSAAAVLVIIVLQSDFTKPAKEYKLGHGISLKLLNGEEFWRLLEKLPEYSKRRMSKLNKTFPLDLSSSQSQMEGTVVNSSASISMTSQVSHTISSSRRFACRGKKFGSKIEKKISSDNTLRNWLVEHDIMCFEDFLFCSKTTLYDLTKMSEALGTGSKVALQKFLKDELESLRQEHTEHLENIKERTSKAKTLGEIFDILNLPDNIRDWFTGTSEDGIGENLDDQDPPSILKDIEDATRDILMSRISNETCRREMLAVFNVVTGKKSRRT